MRTIAALSLLMTVAAASAADFPKPPLIYPPPPMPPLVAFPLWAGFYVGGNLGGGWANTSADFTAAGVGFASADNHMSGVTGGMQAGYNWQNGPYVFGAETDFQAANIDGTLSTACPVALCGVPLSARYEQKVPWFGTVRARVGYGMDSWLIYATGGYAYARLQTDAAANAGGATAHLSQDNTRSGWAAGGGIEVALARRWSVRAEYLFMDFANATTTWAVPGLPRLSDDTTFNMNVVRAGVNYRF